MYSRISFTCAVLPRGLSFDRNSGRIPVDLSAENSRRFPAEISRVLNPPVGNPLSSVRKQGHSADYAFSPARNPAELKRNPARMIRAVAIRILRQILLVIVGAEAFSCTEISGLSFRGHAVGRLSVDVDVGTPVDLLGPRRCRSRPEAGHGPPQLVALFEGEHPRRDGRRERSGIKEQRVPMVAAHSPAQRKSRETQHNQDQRAPGRQ